MANRARQPEVEVPGPTKETLLGGPWRLYVYVSYGIHCCVMRMASTISNLFCSHSERHKYHLICLSILRETFHARYARRTTPLPHSWRCRSSLRCSLGVIPTAAVRQSSSISWVKWAAKRGELITSRVSSF